MAAESPQTIINPSAIGRPDRFDDDFEEPVEWDGAPDPLEYSELRAYGYQYLVEPIMNAGGYIAVSNRLGVHVTPKSRRRRAAFAPGEEPKLLRPSDAKEGFLALGSALDERMEAAAAAAPQRAAERSARLFEKQALMDADERAARRDAAEAAPVYRRAAPEVVAARAAADAAADAADAAALPRERIGLSALQRAYVLATAVSAAVGFGRGTPAAVDVGLPEAAVQAAAAVGFALLLANAGSAVLSARMASRGGRGVVHWALKGALAGPVSVAELRGLVGVEGVVQAGSGGSDSS
ncbi:hypothetical protein JKP88DRAFT_348878 [Tribonema minus]|uniref:Uncharacterized protein n=1 Tax=Tribonema minus TaxID=303371 RepID=A0A835Z3J1_9STRA|nr:hypothetical protein JKP88DRAFT_348878 [Tribonema minus]